MTTPVRVGRIVLVGVVGVFAAIGLLQGAVVALGLGLVAAALAGMIGYGIAHENDRVAAQATVLRFAAAGLCSALALAGLATVFGSAAVPMAMLASAGFASWYFLRDRRGTSGPGKERIMSPEELAALSDSELGREWRRSHAGLVRARTGDELARICALRRHQLDEMERRNPIGFHRWIAGGGWVTGDSAPFLGGS